MADVHNLPLPAGIDGEPFRTLAALAAAELRAIDAALPRLAVYRVADVDAELLPLLGWQMHLMREGWDLADTPARRRALIRDAILLHRMKGTPAAVTRAVAALGFDGARVVEAAAELRRDGTVRRDGGEPYGDRWRWATFRLELPVAADAALDGDTVRRLAAAIGAWKPARSHLTALGVRVEAAAGRDTVPALRVGLRAGLTLRAAPPAERDGRHARGGWRPVGRHGAFTYDGSATRAGLPVGGPVIGPPPLTARLRAGLHLPARRAPGLPRDGAIRMDGRRTRADSGPVMRMGLRVRRRVPLAGSVGFRVADPGALVITHVGLGASTAPEADHLTDALLVPVTPVPDPPSLIVPWTIAAGVAAGMDVGEIGLVCADGSLAVRIAFGGPVPIGPDEEWTDTWHLVPAPTREELLP
ncbi:phage tail protein [Azospirillum halopraeferens]|uniref:phage tail protein n=1 Tax=Azospirillum halopraeferens TaxID=34010 RepID=UPI000417C6A3|nr:phage tail protein [Azospirillum halopraeferens]